MIVGVVLAVIGLAVGGFAFWQWRKLSMIGGAPVAKTGQLQGAASEKGLIAVEGAIQSGGLVAPCSGRPCLYYEVTIHQRWEKHKQENGKTRKVTGKKQISKDSVGSRFSIDDGSGPAQVDATDGKVQSKLEKSFEQEGPRQGNVQFGDFNANIPPFSGEGWGTGSLCVEKIVPAEGSAYVAGSLQGDTIVRKQNMGGRLIVAREGLEALQKSSKMKAVAAVVGALGLTIGGGTTAALSDAPGTPSIVELAPGFSPDPVTHTGLSGGFTEASTMNAACAGTVSENPDVTLNVTADIPTLRVMVKSTVDVTLMVRTPSGEYLCNDDFEDYNPAVTAPFPAGEYAVWVGSYNAEEHSAYTLGFTQSTSAQPSSL